MFVSMSIITKTGDKGQTYIIGRKVSKTDKFIEAIGTIDELNASIGVAFNYIKNKQAKKILKKIMNDLFKIGAETAGAKQKITQKDTETIEKEALAEEKKLPKQKGFILPAGKAAAHLNLARTICRKAERRILSCKPNQETIKYLNRLGDLLFIYSIAEKKDKKQKTI